MIQIPNAVDKLIDVTNIEFDFALASPTVDASKIDIFVANLSMDLKLRGNKMREVLLLPTIVKVKRVREYMNAARVIKEARSSLCINKNALGQQLFNPGDLPSCSLHTRMRMAERVTKMLSLAGMRLAVTHNKHSNKIPWIM